MNLSDNMVLFLYLLIILTLTLLPVLLFRKSIIETFFVGVVILVFFFFHRGLFLGTQTAAHDTFWSYEIMFSLMKQWVNCRFYPGWNPFMNAGEPIYMFNNSYLKALPFFFCLSSQFIKIDSNILFYSSWIYLFLNFCIGSFLLFIILFNDFKVAFFCFTSLLFSSLFSINLSQPTGIVLLYFLPYILFSILVFLKNKSPYGLVFAAIYAGMSFNYYLPSYLFLVLITFFTTCYLFNQIDLKTIYLTIKRHYKLFIGAIFIAILAASPALLLRSELNDYVFPTRGKYDTGIALSINDEGAHKRVSAPLEGYRILLDKEGGIHHAFYFGIIPLILIPLALFIVKDGLAWAFFPTAVIMMLLGLGKRFFLFPAIAGYPGVRIIGETFGFAQYVSFLLICLSGFGLKRLLYSYHKNYLKIFLIVITFSIALYLISHNIRSIRLVLASLSVLILSLLLLRVFKNQNISRRIAFIIIFSILVLDLCYLLLLDLCYLNVFSPPAAGYHLDEPSRFEYPLERTFYAEKSTPVPLNLYPLFYKEASVTTEHENYVFCRSKRLDDMYSELRNLPGYEKAFGVGTPIIYFTNAAVIFGDDLNKELVIREIYDYFKKSGGSEKMKVFFQKDEIDFDACKEAGYDYTDSAIDVTEKNNPNRLGLIIRTPVAGYLVRQENFHIGWSATIDGIPARIYRANYAFQAIKVPAGKHVVIFKFKTIYPILVFISMGISIIVWLCFVYYLFNL